MPALTAALLAELADQAEQAASEGHELSPLRLAVACIAVGLPPSADWLVWRELANRAAQREGYADDQHRHAARRLAVHYPPSAN